MDATWLILILVLLPIGLFADWMAHSDVTDGVAALIRDVFLGRPLEDSGLALSPSLRVEALCLPLTEEELQRVHACCDVRRAEVQVESVHGMKMYLGVADLVVRYDFEGVDRKGETVTVQRTAFLRVKYDSHRSRLGLRSVTLKEAGLWEPTEAERARLTGRG